MSLKLARTVSFFYDDGSESVTEINVLKFDDGREVITIGREGEPSGMIIHDQAHLDDLIRNLTAVANKVF